MRSWVEGPRGLKTGRRSDSQGLGTMNIPMALELVQSASAALTCPNHYTSQGQRTQDSVLSLLPRVLTLSYTLHSLSDGRGGSGG